MLDMLQRRSRSRERPSMTGSSSTPTSGSAHGSPSSEDPAATLEKPRSRHVQTKEVDRSDIEKIRKEHDVYIIREEDCYDELGFGFPEWKKWLVLTVIFLVQLSMNFNTSLYSNGIAGISEEYGVSEQGARTGAMIFLVFYAFGCELWAPWSEELGRKPILQLSLLLVNIWQIPVALAPNFATILVGRALGGLSTAGGSVTLGMVADMFESDVQQHAVAYIVYSSVGGAVLGPIVGGFVEEFIPGWRWTIWIQLIFGGAVQIIHLLTVPETRATIMMDNIAKKRRRNGEENVYGPNELVPWRERFSMHEILVTWFRPFKMFLTEPIVLTLSLLSGFSDALIFMFIQSFALVYKQWGFSAYQIGLAFLPLAVGYAIAWISFIPAINANRRAREAKPNDERVQYEGRLWWLLYLAPCLPIGLIGFAWTSGGPPIHWIGSMVFSAIIGIANYAIYMATIDYMICAYGPYSASATGGNGWARDFLAGVLTLPATPFYQNIGPEGRHYQYASTILFCIAVVLVSAVYVIYVKGETLRKRSPFAQSLAMQAKGEITDDRTQRAAEAVAAMTGDADDHPRRPMSSRRSSQQREVQEMRLRSAMGSRAHSRANSRHNSRSNSVAHTPIASRRQSMDAAPSKA